MQRTLFFSMLLLSANCSKKCNSRKYDQDSIVCVCNADYCDTIDPLEPLPKGEYAVYTSDKNGMRFEKVSNRFTSLTNQKTVKINRNNRYQEIIGFGGAFTDATGININSLNAKAGTNLLKSYFSKEGIEYNMGRVPIGGTDFSTHGYSYMDDNESIETHFTVRNFTLAKEDFNYKIPLIKESELILGRKLKLFASAWTSPKAWKTNGKYYGLGYLRKTNFQDWADYHIRFLELYEQQGLNFWGISTGNEPLNYLLPFIKIPTVPFFWNNQVEWINEHMGPTLRKSKFSETKLIGLDDQRTFVPLLELQLLNNVTRGFIDGVGVHWYMDKYIPNSVISNFHRKYPEKFMFASEACISSEPVVLGSWDRAERYADNIIDDLLNFMGGWVDWNMVLNVKGGPTYINNFVDSPILVDSSAGEFYKQPTFYAIGHFSKFLPERSIHIDVEKQRGLKIVAFERPDNGTAIIILNKKIKSRALKLADPDRGEIILNVAPKSVSTIVYW
ncbi:PREDICTED: glucosylceramidase-like [Nicrophorus vespilloides]|uniref:Glucosylceramidase n=1 Tax=Nicrophorus vespilloides TaxID=110193 RepID=A0ABM1MPM6_NICVS|nr:PREDICTED: glucosylceramidase-like [Nicrophorus vespilloides]